MVIFVLLEGLTHGKVEWHYISLEHGVLLLTLIGPMMMHKLSVTKWDTLNLVRVCVHLFMTIVHNIMYY